MIEYNYNDLKELIEQLKEHRPKIKISASESIVGFYQAKDDEDIAGVEISFDKYKNESEDIGGVGEVIELNQSKKIYEGRYHHDGEAWYDLDALIKNINDYLLEDPEWKNNPDDISWDGFYEWAMDDGNIELYRPDHIYSNDACNIISYSLGSNDGENNIGWNEIWELKSQEWDLKIITN